MTAHRFAGNGGRASIGLADLAAGWPRQGIADEGADPFRQVEFDAVDVLELIDAFGAEALIELIRARLAEDDDDEDWDDVAAAALARNRPSHSLH
jgi:hypothetical protein